MSLKIVISCAKADEEITIRLYQDLKRAGTDPWMARYNVIPGQFREKEIKKAIKKSAFFLPILSTRFIEERGDAHKYLRCGLDALAEIPPDTIYIIPVRLDNCQITYDELSGYECADLFPSYEDGLARIKQSLGIADPFACNLNSEKEKRPDIDNNIVRKRTSKTTDQAGFVSSGKMNSAIGSHSGNYHLDTLKELFGRVERLRLEKQFFESLRIYDQILLIDPKNIRALRERSDIMNLYLTAKSKQFLSERISGIQSILDDEDGKRIELISRMEDYLRVGMTGKAEEVKQRIRDMEKRIIIKSAEIERLNNALTRISISSRPVASYLSVISKIMLKSAIKSDDPYLKEALSDKKTKLAENRNPHVLRDRPETVGNRDFRDVFHLSKTKKPIDFISNQYIDNGDGTITDHATGLMWQKSGTDSPLNYEPGEEYIDKMNSEMFIGFDDWRLPTVDELLSLMESKKSRENNLFIHPVFDNTQEYCWSADKASNHSAWTVSFKFMLVEWNSLAGGKNYVRAVRSFRNELCF